MGANHNYGYAAQEVFHLPIPRAVKPYDELGKEDIVIFNQNLKGFIDSAIACVFPVDSGWITAESLNKLLPAATGIPERGDPALLMKIGERICNLERVFNVREGFDRKDDNLPARMMAEPLLRGSAEGQRVEHLDEFLDGYYEMRGWTCRGIPTPDKLRELGLDAAASDVKAFIK